MGQQEFATVDPQMCVAPEEEPVACAPDDQELLGNDEVQRRMEAAAVDDENGQCIDPPSEAQSSEEEPDWAAPLDEATLDDENGQCIDPSIEARSSEEEPDWAAPLDEATLDDENGQCIDPSSEDQVCEEEPDLTAPRADAPDVAPAKPEVDEAQKADRAACATELRDKFDVVPDGYTGLRDPNTLTESEYAETVAAYSDIKLGRSDLKIAPGDAMPTADQEAFKTGALDDLSTMMQTEEGRAVIHRLGDNTAGGAVDADGAPVHHTTTITPGTQENPHSNPVAGGDVDAMNGQGADVVTQYAPGLPSMPPFGTDDQWAKGVRSDVTLFHELTHAVHQTEGSFDNRNVPREERVDGEGTARIGYDEYETVGLNGYYNMTDDVVTTESAYRDARSGVYVGSKEGDRDMPIRDHYQPKPSSGF